MWYLVNLHVIHDQIFDAQLIKKTIILDLATLLYYVDTKGLT